MLEWQCAINYDLSLQKTTANIEQRKTKIKKSTAKGKKLTANSQIKIPLQSWNDNVLLITICHFKSQHRTANIEQRKTKIKKPNKDSSTRSEWQDSKCVLYLVLDTFSCFKSTRTDKFVTSSKILFSEFCIEMFCECLIQS